MDTPIEPQVASTNVVPPIPETPKPKIAPEIIAAAVVVVFGALLLLGLRFLSNQSAKPPVVVEKPAPTPTPTPVRLPSALATQSAFLKLEGNVASLSASIKNYVVDDPSLSPPVLDLPLGFQ
ncbi:hypothetical protein HY086_02505 [Candidatus Gottesmanbacteria bacterium]|nr:hypothetical protein [Candidatus Gottesmanbacteria bacterium]